MTSILAHMTLMIFLLIFLSYGGCNGDIEQWIDKKSSIENSQTMMNDNLISSLKERTQKYIFPAVQNHESMTSGLEAKLMSSSVNNIDIHLMAKASVAPSLEPTAAPSMPTYVRYLYTTYLGHDP